MINYRIKAQPHEIMHEIEKRESPAARLALYAIWDDIRRRKYEEEEHEADNVLVDDDGYEQALAHYENREPE